MATSEIDWAVPVESNSIAILVFAVLNAWFSKTPGPLTDLINGTNSLLTPPTKYELSTEAAALTLLSKFSKVKLNTTVLVSRADANGLSIS